MRNEPAALVRRHLIFLDHAIDGCLFNASDSWTVGSLTGGWLTTNASVIRQLEECERIIVRRATTNVGSTSN
jgi:hypothetical protein